MPRTESCGVPALLQYSSATAMSAMSAQVSAADGRLMVMVSGAVIELAMSAALLVTMLPEKPAAVPTAFSAEISAAAWAAPAAGSVCRVVMAAVAASQALPQATVYRMRKLVAPDCSRRRSFSIKTLVECPCAVSAAAERAWLRPSTSADTMRASSA